SIFGVGTYACVDGAGNAGSVGAGIGGVAAPAIIDVAFRVGGGADRGPGEAERGAARRPSAQPARMGVRSASRRRDELPMLRRASGDGLPRFGCESRGRSRTVGELAARGRGL